MGSKNRIAGSILPIMLKEVELLKLTTWVEPFVGGANMVDRVPTTLARIGIDFNPHTIKALIAIRDQAQTLPERLTPEEYKVLKGADPEEITSWLRFVCSVGGKFENGYARDAKNRNYAKEGKNNALKQSPKLQGVKFIHGSYEEYSDFKNCLIYCDPPYQGTTSYKTGTFNHFKFWEWCREMSKNNVVYISEYSAPEDFICVWSGEVKTNFAFQRKGATHNAVERLYTYI
jgi:DNA adenine methylase